jgi:hypothetical protein
VGLGTSVKPSRPRSNDGQTIKSPPPLPVTGL